MIKPVHILIIAFICAVSVGANMLWVKYAPTRSMNVTVGEQSFTLEIAADYFTRKNGLMHRRDLAPCGGMVFLFPRPAQLQFWMHDTPTPLWIAFVNAQQRIIRLYPKASPMNDTPLHADGLANTVIEINAECPKLEAIKEGDAVNLTIPDDLDIR